MDHGGDVDAGGAKVGGASGGGTDEFFSEEHGGVAEIEVVVPDEGPEGEFTVSVGWGLVEVGEGRRGGEGGR